VSAHGPSPEPLPGSLASWVPDRSQALPGITNVTKTALTSPIKLPMDKAISAILPTVATGAKLIGGVVLGFVFDALVESVFDPTGKKLRAAFKAGHGAGVAAMADEAKSAIKIRLAHEGRDAMLLEELRRAALFSGSKPALDGLNNWIISQIPALSLPVHDLSLYNSMLETWVLQRAGDEEDANKHTDSDAYEAAHEKFATDGNLARRDLFIHQCRFEFGRLGVDAEPTLAIWNKKLTSQPKDLPLEEVIGRLGPIHLETSRFSHPQRLAQYLGERFAWDDDFDLMPSPEQLAEQKNRASGSWGEALSHADGIPQHVERAKQNSPRFERMVSTGGVRLACNVMLTEADGAIFVDRYAYRIWGTRHDAKGTPRDKAGSTDTKAPTKTWSDSPD